MKIGDLFIKLGLRKDGFDKGIDGAKRKTTAFGSAMKKIGGLIGGVFAAGALISFGRELLNIARQAEGVREAFSRIGTETDLENLRRSVKGTVSDLELMKRAVLAENFGIPIQNLGNLLEFASKRAQDTGQSVDYLVDSIVTGIGRKSPLILDNLGISAVQLKENLNGVAIGAASVGDVAEAVGRIAERSLNETGRLTGNLGVKVQSLGAKWDNLKLKVSDIFSNSEGLKKDLDDWGKLIEVWQSDSLTTWKKFWASVRGSAMDEYYDQIKKEQEADANRQKDFQGRTLKSLQKDYEIYMNNFIDATIKGNNEAASHFEEMANKIRARIRELNQEVVEPDVTTIQEKINSLNAIIDLSVQKMESTNDVEMLKQASEDIKEAQKELETLIMLRNNLNRLQTPEEITPIAPPISVTGGEGLDTTTLGDVSPFLEQNKERLQEAYQAQLDETKAFTDQMNMLIDQGVADMATTFASGIGQLASGEIGMDDFFKMILSSIGKFLQQIGAALIAYGVAMDAFKKAFTNPFVAIAAGAALVAIGSFISSKASAGPAGGGASSYTPASSGYSNFNASSGTAALEGNVVFELEGTKLKGVLNNTDRRNSLIR